MFAFLIVAAAQAVVPSSATAVRSEDKMVCELTQEDAGSRILKKICLKQSTWDAMAKETQDDLQNSRNDRSTTDARPR